MHTLPRRLLSRLTRPIIARKRATWAGPVLDMGPYPVNAARYIFGDEPTEVVSAGGTRHPESGFEQSFDDIVAVTLRFPGNRLAQFNLSYYGGSVNSFVAVGPKGSVMLDPSYMFGQPIEQTLAVGQGSKKRPSRTRIISAVK